MGGRIGHPELPFPRKRKRIREVLAVEARRHDDITDAAATATALSPCVISTSVAQAQLDRRGGVTDIDHERAAANRVSYIGLALTWPCYRYP